MHSLLPIAALRFTLLILIEVLEIYSHYLFPLFTISNSIFSSARYSSFGDYIACFNWRSRVKIFPQSRVVYAISGLGTVFLGSTFLSRLRRYFVKLLIFYLCDHVPCCYFSELF